MFELLTGTIGLILLFIWLPSWIATIIISSKKGEGCVSVFSGLLFGPIALIVAIVSKGNKDNCQYCRELINRKAIVCPFCQKENPIPLIKKPSKKIQELVDKEKQNF